VMKLNDIWRALEANPTQQVIIIYNDNSNPGFWPSSLTYSTWRDTWGMDIKQQSLKDGLAAAPVNKLISFSGAATPDAKLIILGVNPVATRQFHYPTTLRDLADNTNPVTLYWIKLDEDITKGPIGLLGMDFINTTCAVEVALQRNKVQVSLADCTITTETYWKDWHALRKCPDGFSDDFTLLYCQKPEKEFTRPGYPWKIGDKPFDFSAAMKRCEDAHGAGKCENYGGIYYPKCDMVKANFHPVGCCVCSYNCPDGFPDVGAMCQK